MNEPARPSPADARLLVADMVGALRSEYGARRMYGLLMGRVRDEELRGVIATLHAECGEQIQRLRALMTDLGGDPPERSARRTLMAWLLFLATPLVGLRFALRLCCDAEARVGRWYHGYGAWLAEAGCTDFARRCQELSVVKWTHARVLQTFVDHAPGRFRS